jgi:hypothetical protein
MTDQGRRDRQLEMFQLMDGSFSVLSPLEFGQSPIEHDPLRSACATTDDVPPTTALHLDHSDGSGTRPFLALANLELHLLAFAEFLELHALHFRAVEEQISVSRFDETETTIRHHFLDRTLWHCCPSTEISVKPDLLVTPTV